MIDQTIRGHAGLVSETLQVSGSQGCPLPQSCLIRDEVPQGHARLVLVLSRIFEALVYPQEFHCIQALTI